MGQGRSEARVDPQQSLYSYLYDEVSRHWALTSVGRAGPNFEDILYLIASIMGLFPAGHFTSSLASVAALRSFPDIIHFKTTGPVDTNRLRLLASGLVDRLLYEFRERCRNLTTLGTLSPMFDALSTEFDCAYATTNYDDLIWRSKSDLETGFGNDGRFSPSQVFERPIWPCLLHLHGSIHFDMRHADRGLHEIHWQGDLNEPFKQNAFGRNPTMVHEGPSFPTSVIIAGYGKTQQLQGQPFRTYHSELDRLSSQADAVLFLGYGFGDEHVNGAFLSFRDHRRRPAVVVGLAPDEQMGVTGAAGLDTPVFAFRASQIFGASPLEMRWDDQHVAPATLGEIKETGKFERSVNPSRPLALWYAGAEALQSAGLDKLLAELA